MEYTVAGNNEFIMAALAKHKDAADYYKSQMKAKKRKKRMPRESPASTSSSIIAKTPDTPLGEIPANSSEHASSLSSPHSKAKKTTRDISTESVQRKLFSSPMTKMTTDKGPTPNEQVVAEIAKVGQVAKPN